MIVDTCIISIDWGFEEMRFDEGKIQVLQKENRNINELDVSQQKWIVVLPLSYFFWCGGFEYTLLSSPSWEHPQVTLLFFSMFFAASTTNQGSVSWCIGQSRYHLPRLASKYVPTCQHAPICLQWNKYNRCAHCLAIFLPLLKRPNWWFLQQRISTGLQGCTGAGTVWLLRGRAWIFPRCDWTWSFSMMLLVGIIFIFLSVYLLKMRRYVTDVWNLHDQTMIFQPFFASKYSPTTFHGLRGAANMLDS